MSLDSNIVSFATAVGTAVKGKVSSNTAITAGTATKVTYDSKGLVTGGTSLAASDIPSLDASKITTGTLSVGTSGNAATATKLATARTINGTSFDGSANITITSNTPNSQTMKFDTGTTEGTDLYTFNGSASKTIDIKAGTNVTLTKTAGSISINATMTSVSWSAITSKPTTLTGYGITDAALSTHNHSGVYEPVIAAGTTAQYLRGDKTWQTMPTSLPASDVYAWAKASTKPSYTYSEVGSPSTTGVNASGTWGINVTGNSATATKLTNSSGDWVGSGAIANVVGMLAWKNYSNGHAIFDASAGTAPNGTAVNNTNSQNGWSASFPTLMGWNGSQTYGVRVDAARYSESCTGNAATATTAGNANQLIGKNWYWSGQGGQPAWLWGGSDGTNMYVYNPSNFSVNYANSAGSTTYAQAFTTAVGSAPSYACRAWVNFNGTGTVAIRASGNVSSITDNGTGDYTVNFTTAMADANYSAPTGVSYTPGAWRNLHTYSKTSSALRLQVMVYGGGFVDESTVDVAIFR